MSVLVREFIEQIAGWIAGNVLGTASIVVGAVLALVVKSREFRVAAVLVVALLVLGVGGSIRLTHQTHPSDGPRPHSTATVTAEATGRAVERGGKQ